MKREGGVNLELHPLLLHLLVYFTHECVEHVLMSTYRTQHVLQVVLLLNRLLLNLFQRTAFLSNLSIRSLGSTNYSSQCMIIIINNNNNNNIYLFSVT